VYCAPRDAAPRHVPQGNPPARRRLDAAMRHLHLDPVGGIAGDMFVAALLDAAPEHTEPCLRAAEAVAGVPCRLLRHHDHVLAGTRFAVAAAATQAHHHVPWREIRERLEAAPLDPAARRHALGIFGLLAEAEGRVHGIAPEAVTFHEVGAADSLADIVAAAVLIAVQADADGPARWSCAPLPLGSGRVASVHGSLPVPAPATALLLEGFVVIDDGIAGERVTPTGAAILRHLGANAPAPAGPQRLLASGIGFGTRALPGLSNVLRVLISEAGQPATAPGHRELAVIAFEVDDQSPEDLAIGLDRLRALAGVHDAVQMPAFGKKGRMAAHIQVLAAPEALEGVVEACFRETSTIGLRIQHVAGRTLARWSEEVLVDGRTVRVKRVERPGGATGKAESDDLAPLAGQAARERLRRAAEGRTDG
jgi:uncharacterized protein (TIGR00299 family) protein